MRFAYNLQEVKAIGTIFFLIARECMTYHTCSSTSSSEVALRLPSFVCDVEGEEEL
jgi:hypothetical protein